MAEIILDKDFMGLGEKIRTINKKAPGKIIDRMDKLGRKTVKHVKSRTPESKSKKTSRERLRNRYKAYDIERKGDSWEKPIGSTAPHFHLVERGHDMVLRSGKFVRRIEGKSYFEKAMDEFESTIDTEMDKMVDDIFADLGI